MYRIIGIIPNGKMKLIKKEALNSTVKWWSDYTTDKTWPESLIYTTLNGKNYLLNDTYVPTGWESKIVTHDWYYGDITTSRNYDGATMYPIENPFGESTASNRFTKTVSAKIGLMYIHDYFTHMQVEEHQEVIVMQKQHGSILVKMIQAHQTLLMNGQCRVTVALVVSVRGL